MGIDAWHIMRKKISMGPVSTAQDVAMKIISSGLAAMPIVDEQQEVLGVVTEIGILGAIRQGTDLAAITAASIMVPAPLVADINTPSDELVRMLLENCCSVITVLNEKKYAGVISRHMLMDAFTSPRFSRYEEKERKGPFACI